MWILDLPNSSYPDHTDSYLFLTAVVKLRITHEMPQGPWVDRTVTL